MPNLDHPSSLSTHAFCRRRDNRITSRVPSAGILLSLLFVGYACTPSGPPDPTQHAVMSHGGVTRLDTTRKVVYLTFTGHEFADGGEVIQETLRAKGVRASFFFTGEFYRDPRFSGLIHSLRAGGHYLGAHSDKHLLYASWDDRDSTLVSREEWWTDLEQNYREMERFGVRFSDARWFMPPYEWYNDSVAAWTKAEGLQLVNFTAGTLTNADYTTPGMGKQYRSSDEIESRLLSVEEREGLRGYILLLHIGTHPERTDKFYLRLGHIIDTLRSRGYTFASFADLS